MSEGFIGEIKMFGGNFAPRSWALCDGQLLAISANTALFSILGTTYGGDGRSTFGLPDLRGRIAMHEGNGPGLPSYRLGEKGGAFQKTLNLTEMPSHNHTVTLKVNSGNANDGDETSPVNTFPGGAASDRFYENSNAAGGPPACSNTGGSQSFSIQNPFCCVNFIICLQGVFPSRS